MASSGSNLDEQIERLKRCELLTEKEVENLCFKAREILIEEGNVQLVDTPITICGDIHGLYLFYFISKLYRKIPGNL